MIVHGVWQLTPERVAIHLPTETAVITDAHLGYAQARRAKGEAVPLVAVEDYFAPLLRVLARYSVQGLVIAGDLFEKKADPEVVEEFLGWLADVKLNLLGVAPGNHDRGIEEFGHLVRVYPEGIPLDDWRVVHGHRRLPKQRVVHGHVHPCFRLGMTINAPCFLFSERRIVLPAFSPDAAGVNVLGESEWRRYRCVVCAGEKVLDFGELARLQRVAK